MLMTVEARLPSIPVETMDRVRLLLEEGRCISAFELARGFGELTRWRGTPERLLAGRLVPHVGSPRLGMAIHYRALAR